MIDPFVQAKAEVMLTGYDARWGADMALYDVLGVEVEWRWGPLAGKVDAIVREKTTGRHLLVEHKTTSQDASPGSTYMRLLKLNTQISLYWYGMSQDKNLDVDACLYDVLCKPGQRPLKAGAKRAADETPEEYRARLIEKATPDQFLRAEVVRMEDELWDAYMDAVDTKKAIDSTKRWVRNPDACFRYNSLCSHFEVCCGEASHENNDRFEVVKRVHQELGEGLTGVVTTSSLGCYRACPRLYHYRYGLGIRARATSEALSFGTLIYKGLEAYWRAKDGERLEAALGAVRGGG